VNVHGRLCGFGLSAILLVCIACDESEEPDPPVSCEFHGGIRDDVTMYKACSPYVLRGGIDVLDSATLTIEPGVEVRFGTEDSFDWLEIAAAGTTGATLIAEGTPDQPIVLTAGVDAATSPVRSFLGLWFNGGTRAGSILSNAIIRRAGGDNQVLDPTLIQGCITVTDVADGAVTIENVILEDCVNAGVVLKGSRPNMSDLTLVDMEVGFLLDGVAADVIPESVTYEEVQQTVVEAEASRP
jgi:hypothetical protein